MIESRKRTLDPRRYRAVLKVPRLNDPLRSRPRSASPVGGELRRLPRIDYRVAIRSVLDSVSTVQSLNAVSRFSRRQDGPVWGKSQALDLPKVDELTVPP